MMCQSQKVSLILMLILIMLGVSCEAQNSSKSPDVNTENLFIITIDGLRWQEVFTGADSVLIRSEEFVDEVDTLVATFWAETPAERRKELMPFFWQHFGSEGQVYGNPHLNSLVSLSNRIGYSYAGYSEILVGFADDKRIKSNAMVWNPNKTVLEFINEQPRFRGRVAVFGSWRAFPYIVNAQRSGIPVNAGFAGAEGPDLTSREQFLNELVASVPSPWATVRFDAFTHHYTLEYLKKAHPRVVFVAFSETDDFAHDGRYDAYLHSTHQNDASIGELLEFVRSSPFYKDKTTIILTSDHGRGHDPIENWQRHDLRPDSYVPGSDKVWLAVWGPDIPALGEMKDTEEIMLNQIAKTAASLLGLDYKNDRPVGASISAVIGNK